MIILGICLLAGGYAVFGWALDELREARAERGRHRWTARHRAVTA